MPLPFKALVPSTHLDGWLRSCGHGRNLIQHMPGPNRDAKLSVISCQLSVVSCNALPFGSRLYRNVFRGNRVHFAHDFTAKKLTSPPKGSRESSHVRSKTGPWNQPRSWIIPAPKGRRNAAQTIRVIITIETIEQIGRVSPAGGSMTQSAIVSRTPPPRVRDTLGGVRSQNLIQGGRCWRQTAGFRRRLGGEPCRLTLVLGIRPICHGPIVSWPPPMPNLGVIVILWLYPL